jgi:hypothetical protein
MWQVVTSLMDWNAMRPDQIESFAVRELSVNSSYSLYAFFALISSGQKHVPIIEPFSQASKTQIALLNIVQVYCYENTRVMKAFPQILKVT